MWSRRSRTGFVDEGWCVLVGFVAVVAVFVVIVVLVPVADAGGYKSVRALWWFLAIAPALSRVGQCRAVLRSLHVWRP